MHALCVNQTNIACPLRFMSAYGETGARRAKQCTIAQTTGLAHKNVHVHAVDQHRREIGQLKGVNKR
jgi:hypothetical protein